MRSDLVHTAKKSEANPFVLCQTVNTAVRKLHNPTQGRIQDSVNQALLRVAGVYVEPTPPENPAAEAQPEKRKEKAWQLLAGEIREGTHG